jgi:hypothetical protein
MFYMFFFVCIVLLSHDTTKHVTNLVECVYFIPSHPICRESGNWKLEINPGERQSLEVKQGLLCDSFLSGTLSGVRGVRISKSCRTIDPLTCVKLAWFRREAVATRVSDRYKLDGLRGNIFTFDAGNSHPAKFIQRNGLSNRSRFNYYILKYTIICNIIMYDIIILYITYKLFYAFYLKPWMLFSFLISVYNLWIEVNLLK